MVPEDRSVQKGVLWVQVDVVAPTGKLLARRLSLIIEQGHSVLVTGPNGSGKSSLFRILGGLWPMTSGSIHRPGGGSADARIFYVPQKPYTTIGTLREQVICVSTFYGSRLSLSRLSITKEYRILHVEKGLVEGFAPQMLAHSLTARMSF